MKKKLGKKILKNAFSLVSGVIGIKNPVAGFVIGATVGLKDQFLKHKKENMESEIGGEGNVDYSGIIGSIIGGVVVLLGSYMLKLLEFDCKIFIYLHVI